MRRTFLAATALLAAATATAWGQNLGVEGGVQAGADAAIGGGQTPAVQTPQTPSVQTPSVQVPTGVGAGTQIDSRIESGINAGQHELRGSSQIDADVNSRLDANTQVNPSQGATMRGNAGVDARVGGSATAGASDNQWRYKHHNGHWWYWMPDNRWVYWYGNSWQPFSAQSYYSHYPRGSYSDPRYRTGYRGTYNDGYRYDNYGNRYYDDGYRRTYSRDPYGRMYDNRYYDNRYNVNPGLRVGPGGAGIRLPGGVGIDF